MGVVVAPKPPEPLSMWRIGSALALVLAAIFALRWASRKVLGLPAGGSSTSAVSVLGRSVIGPRQQVLLIRVGQRILVVANSGATMNSLCEITDPDEVATILGQINRPRPEGEPGAFASMFARAGETFETESTPRSQDGDAELTATRAEIGGLLDKVRTLSRSFRRA
jgi:flagellar biogenesis protein FliO